MPQLSTFLPHTPALLDFYHPANYELTGNPKPASLGFCDPAPLQGASPGQKGSKHPYESQESWKAAQNQDSHPTVALR